MQKLLEYQDERGLFPTIGHKKYIGQKENSRRTLDSIFLHTFVLEYLLDHHSKDEAGAIQKGLDFLVSQAINEKGTQVWQWLKNPPSEEDRRPPDTDDTMRARLVIEKALRKGFDVPGEFQHFDYEKFLQQFMVEDGSIKTYVPDRYSTSCPVVNTNILYALTCIGGQDQIRNKVKKYLERMTDDILTEPNIFITKSRYYLSPLFPMYVLSRTIREEPSLFSAAERNKILEYSRKVTPNTLLERAWKSSILRNFGRKRSLITEVRFDYQRVFQSRRIGEYYGSPAATAVFCLESMK